MPLRVARTVVALSNNFETVEGADDLAIEYAWADLALCAFGVTAYELAAFGVPALYLGLTDDHARSAGAFDAAGMGVSLGLAANVTDDDIRTQIRALLDDPDTPPRHAPCRSGDARWRRRGAHRRRSRSSAEGRR